MANDADVEWWTMKAIDVLREFTDAILEWAGESGTVAEVGTWSDIAAEFAKRLQLKECDDE